ncbi:MAG: hypothetical protein ACLTRS_05855 [Lachnospiraceae bacterium]
MVSAAVTICTGHGRQAHLPEKQRQIKLENRGKIDVTKIEFIKAPHAVTAKKRLEEKPM